VNCPGPPEAEVDGVPTLFLSDENCEAISEALADLLIAALEGEGDERAPS
jgi:hypothetical protein